MRKWRKITLVGGALAAAVFVWACEEAESPIAPNASPMNGIGILGGDHHQPKCPAQKFTGGGRIDPGGEKVTFGFNVHADKNCDVIRGQLQIVHHPTKTKFHSTSITDYSSYASPEGGLCADFRGVVRVKHRTGGWHEHEFRVEACDNGEPGSSPGTGPDTFQASAEDHGDTRRTELTGGNIQAHS